MPITDWQQYAEAIWDWGWLNDSLPGRAAVSDLDGIIERSGRFLVLETKRPGVDVPRGQAIMFDNMVKAGMTVIVIWGHQNQPVRMQVWGQTGVIPATAQAIREVVARWYAEATASRLNANGRG